MFQRQMGLQGMNNSMQQQNWSQLMGQQQENLAVQGQNFGQLATAQQLNNSTQQQNFGQLAQSQQLGQQAQGQNFSQLLQLANFNANEQGQAFTSQMDIAQLLAHMSGAVGGSMGQAGAIEAGKYGQSQDNLSNLISSLGGTNLSGLGNLFGGGQSLQAGGGFGSVPGGYVDPATGQSYNNPSAYTAPSSNTSGGYIPFEAGFAGSY